MLPRMMSSTSGIAMGRAVLTRSRESSFSSVRLSLSRAGLRAPADAVAVAVVVAAPVVAAAVAADMASAPYRQVR